MSAKGLEPLTNGLKGHCSTIELRARQSKTHILVQDKADCILSCPIRHVNVIGAGFTASTNTTEVKWSK